MYNTELTNGRGGVRAGAGRKPKALAYADQTTALEHKILGALPDVVDKFIEQAKAGDYRCGKYLIDRILGRAPILKAPPAEDRELPYADEDLEVDTIRRAHRLACYRSDREQWHDTSIGPHFDDYEEYEAYLAELEQADEDNEPIDDDILTPPPPVSGGSTLSGVGVGFAAADLDQDDEAIDDDVLTPPVPTRSDHGQPDTDLRLQAPLPVSGGGRGVGSPSPLRAPSPSGAESTLSGVAAGSVNASKVGGRQPAKALEDWPAWPDWNPYQHR